MRHVKLDFPRFDGSNPLDWIFWAEQYFAYYHTPDVDRLTIASVNVEGVVIPWFQLLQRANQLPTWSALVTAIELQFGPSLFDSPRARLFKLSQTSSVVEYYNEFLLLANRSQGLTEAALLDCFISGLKDPIRRDVLAQSPCIVLKAVSLARLFDEKATLGLSVPHNRPTSYSTFKVNPNSGTSSLQKSNSSSPNALPPILPTPLTKASPPIRRISPAEQQLRREKGLCFTCDAKYTWNHKCPNKQLMLFDLEEDPSETPLVDSTLAEVPVQDNPSHLSLHAFRGSSSRATIYFRGFIEGKPVRVLLDGGSSNSFIQPRLAHLLHLPVQPSPRLRVMVGDGYCLQTEGYIPCLSVSINGHAITFPAYVLEVSGSEVVMGASWLVTLGSHIVDYSAAQIKFTMGSDFVTLQGENSFVPQIAQYNHFRRLCSIDQISEAYMLSCSSLELENTIMPCFPPDTPSDLLQVLYQYTSVF